MTTEFERIARIRARLLPRPGVLVGAGDDAAVLAVGPAPIVVTTDTMTEDIHFRTAWATPREVGRKLAASNLSDLAAMGARPRYATLSLALPAHVTDDEFEELMDGVIERLEDFGAVLVGGDLTGSPGPRVLTLTLMGDVPPTGALLRSGANAGDLLFVAGMLGEAALALQRFESGARPEDAAARREPPWRALLDPLPRCRLAEALGGLASAAIDVSDGFVQDLGHLATASRLVAEVDVDLLPASVALRALPAAEALELQLAGGEDYALLIAVPAAARRAFEERACNLPDTAPLACVGVLRRPADGETRGAVHLLRGGTPIARNAPGGFDHFRGRPA